jgi:hypothetical protein
MGDAPVGLLAYTDSGTMVTTISTGDRPPIDGNDPLGGRDDHRLAAMTTFFAYAGTFRVDGADVVHDVTVSLYPNWVGGSQRRHAVLSDDRRVLTLSTDLIVARGLPSVQRLVWERVGG